MGLITGIMEIAGKLFGDDKEKLQEFQEEILPLILKHQSDYVQSEVNGRWYQRGWRPALMFTLVLILFSKYIVQPWANAFGSNVNFEFPTEGWEAIMLLAPVAVVARTIDKRPGLVGNMLDTIRRK